jgi:hypothetical protein
MLLMPASDFTHLDDADLADVIAYVKSVPPVDSNLPATALMFRKLWFWASVDKGRIHSTTHLSALSEESCPH